MPEDRGLLAREGPRGSCGRAAAALFALFAAACGRSGFDSYAYEAVGDPTHDAGGRDGATDAAPDAFAPDAAGCPAASGALDRRFGDSGIAALGVIRVEWPIVDPETGDILFLGVQSKGSAEIETSVVRLRADGSLDPTFGEGGARTITELTSPSLARGPDGTIVLFGWTTGAGPGSLAVMRLTPEGALDPTFGANGTALLPTTAGQPRTCFVDHENRILVGGYSGPIRGPFTFVVTRLTPSGAIDSTFGVGGAAQLSFEREALTPRGAVLTTNAMLWGFSERVIRYDVTGEMDSSFGPGGTVTFSTGGNGFLPIDERGGVYGIRAPGLSKGVTHLHDDGTIDTDFGTSGRAWIDVPAHKPGWIFAVAPAPNRGVVAAVEGIRDDAYIDLILERFDGRGAADPGFGARGQSITDLVLEPLHGGQLVILPDGRIVVFARRRGDEDQIAACFCP